MCAQPVKIAIVDDHSLMRISVRKHLSLAGFRILLEAENGLDLLQKLEGETELPDICLVDISMPVMDGYQTAWHLRNNYPSVKIMAYSSFNDKQYIDKIMRCGAHGFINKEDLSEKLSDALLQLHKDL